MQVKTRPCFVLILLQKFVTIYNIHTPTDVSAVAVGSLVCVEGEFCSFYLNLKCIFVGDNIITKVIPTEKKRLPLIHSHI